ncbi:MAG: zeta toxin family protein, partial [Bacteroidales bacterium]|nr:zeta toxin family protein [Bacteroidales bacterium]
MTYSREEFEKAKGKILSKLLLPYISPAVEPQAFLIVGQPGAGKTTMARIFTSQLEKNVIFISGDEYRRFHPRFSDLIKQYGDEAVLHTQEFAGKMTEALIDELSSRKYNLIIEGTLRTVEVPAKTKFQLERRGYDVTMAAILVRPEVS